MSMRRLRALLVGSLCFGLAATAPAVARCQSGSEDEVARDRARFAEAVALADEERYAEALEAFEALQRSRPHAFIVFNIAWCLSRLGRDEEALERFDEYLLSDDDSAARRESAETERARLAALLEGEAPGDEDEPPQDQLSEDPAATEVDETLTARRRRRLRPAGFWATFGLTLATGAAAGATGIATYVLSERWLEEGHVNDRDTGRALQIATDVLLIAAVVEAVAALVLGLYTDFRGDGDREAP